MVSSSRAKKHRRILFPFHLHDHHFSNITKLKLKKTLSPSRRDFVAKFSAAKYDFNLYKGFFKGKMAPNCQILSIISQILRF
jgi:hypothetical protein